VSRPFGDWRQLGFAGLSNPKLRQIGLVLVNCAVRSPRSLPLFATFFAMRRRLNGSLWQARLMALVVFIGHGSSDALAASVGAGRGNKKPGCSLLNSRAVAGNQPWPGYEIPATNQNYCDLMMTPAVVSMAVAPSMMS
jgi:hypothetical protein